MGDYITLADLPTRIPFTAQVELADDKNPGDPDLTESQITTLRAEITAGTTPADARLAALITILNGAITDGEAQVNRYLRYQHATLPLTGDAVTGIIKAHSLTFAAWYLHGRREDIPDDIQAMFEDATAWGESLKPSADATPTTQTAPSPAFNGENREFSRNSFRDW